MPVQKKNKFYSIASLSDALAAFVRLCRLFINSECKLADPRVICMP